MKTHRLGHYRLVRPLDRGGFSQVYLGWHLFLQETVAIKTIKTIPGQEVPVQVFLHEAQLIASLKHPRIIRVRDFGIENGIPYIVMDYAPGGSIRHHCQPGQRLDLPTMLAVVERIAEALAFAHLRGVIHRDVKPENMLLGDQGLVLSDFGIARFAAQIPRSDFLGTSPYAAPEQFQGTEKYSCDQYALGVCVHEWLTGYPPFSGTTHEEIARQHLYTPPPPLRQMVPDLSPDIEAVVLRALAKNPQDRFESINAFAKALSAAASPPLPIGKGQTQQARPRAIPDATSDTPKEPAPLLSPESRFWNMPYHRNPFFVGRELQLEQIHTSIQAKQRVSLSGLGGIGKTQLAVEYAYRFCQNQAVYFIRAEALLGDVLALARAFKFPEKMDWHQTCQALKNLFSSTHGWLIIVDNVEDIGQVEEILPPSGPVILTTRAQSFETTNLDIEELMEEEAVLLLLRRAGSITPETTYAAIPSDLRMQAKKIVQSLDCLPLALDQAGAYIEENRCTLRVYLERYQAQKQLMLKRRGSKAQSEKDHPEPVAATWSLSFARVERMNPLASDILRLCAFFAPDAIPEELLAHGDNASERQVGENQLLLAEAILALSRYSLLRLDPATYCLSMHRLVQIVCQEPLAPESARRWAMRAVAAVSQCFPDCEKVSAWPQAERLIAQAVHCLVLVETWLFVDPEAAHLFNRAGLYFLAKGDYEKAEAFINKALAMRMMLFPHDDLVVAESLNDLGISLSAQGRAAEAEPYLQRALAIKERHQPGHPELAVVYNNLASVYRRQQKMLEAEQYFLKALAIWQIQTGQGPQNEGDPYGHSARTLNNLGLLYLAQQRYGKAESCWLQAIAIWEKLDGPPHPDMGKTLTHLARLYRNQGRIRDAEPLLLRARVIRERALGPDHPDVADTICELAAVYITIEREAEGVSLLAFALDILEQALGASHPRTLAVCQHYQQATRSKNTSW